MNGALAAGAALMQRATGLPEDLAADLAVSGGMLRCGTCQLEEPVGDVETRLSGGWPAHCGHPLLWVPRKKLLAESRAVPAGYELVPVTSPNWRLVNGSRRCRAGASPGHPACGRAAVAELRRHPIMHPTVWWSYCADDMYAHWIEDGQVKHWILKEEGEPADAAR